jgi:hypothetical protein
VGLLVIFVTLYAYFTPDKVADYISLGFYIVFLSYTIVLILAYILRNTKVTLNIIMGAVCVYLLMDIVWGMGYALLDAIIPNSFNIADMDAGSVNYNLIRNFIYYSMSTMATLGIGDIVPLSTPARYLSSLEAISGQMYLSILVARLVGMHISQK